MLSAVAAFSERARIAFIQLLTFILIENNVSIDPQGMARMRPRKRHVDPYSLHNSPPKAPLHLILLPPFSFAFWTHFRRGQRRRAHDDIQLFPRGRASPWRPTSDFEPPISAFVARASSCRRARALPPHVVATSPPRELVALCRCQRAGGSARTGFVRNARRT